MSMRPRMLSFRMPFALCASTVFTLRSNRDAISLLVLPHAIDRNTSVSRGLRGVVGSGVAALA